jgi:hypothetical protein
MLRILVLSTALLVSATTARAATVDVVDAITPVYLNQWNTGYNAGFSLSFDDVLGAGESLSNWSLAVESVEPGSYFSTFWVNGSGDPAVCAYGSPLGMSGYGTTTATFTSSCGATPSKRFDFFLQVQNGTYVPGALNFSLSSANLVLPQPPVPGTELPPSDAVMSAVPLPAGAALMVAGLAALGGISLRRRQAEAA